MQVTRAVQTCDAGNDTSHSDLDHDEGDNDPNSAEEGGPRISGEESSNDPSSANVSDNNYLLEKAKKLLWRLKQRDLLDLIDEVDSTETEKVPCINADCYSTITTLTFI